MWTAFISGNSRNYEYAHRLKEISHFSEATRRRDYEDHTKPRDENCCGWITEAVALAAKGMPIDSFSLVFDGDPAPDQVWKLFDLLKVDAAWQTAQAQWRASQTAQAQWRASLAQALGPRSQSLNLNSTLKRRWRDYETSEVFPQAINDIVNGKTSLVRCNFPTGDLYDLAPFHECK